MTCTEALELVEPIAAGDLAADAVARAHFETCPGCAAQLASARRLDALLASREPFRPPPRCAAVVLQRIRRERWRAEQQVDRLFNVAIGAALLLIGGGLLALMNVGGVLAAAGGTWTAVAALASYIAREAAPSLNTYIAGILLLVSALGMWWYAERTLSL